jgi:hypothetical protein
MAQITSREELEAWLKDKPTDWAQVIAVRAALRVLPIAFAPTVSESWVTNFSFALFRATLVSWDIINIPVYGKDAMRSARNASENTDNYKAQSVSSSAADAAYAAYVSDTDGASDFAADAASNAEQVLDRGIFWPNVAADCNWLESQSTIGALASLLAWVALWPEVSPIGLTSEWREASKRLLQIDPSYVVWLNWYDRRIAGEHSAFDIPADIDRSYDKAILARISNIENEDFWGKGATYVNTTLQSWIDEAREQAAIDYVASGAPLKLGSEAELAAREELAARLASVEDALAALKDQLASLTQTGHGGIGHNQPENAISLRDDEIALLKQQVASLETLLTGVQTQLAKPVPDMGQLVQLVPKLNRWGRMMQVVEDVTSPKVREGLETWAGPAALGAVGYLASTTIPNALAAFSHYFYTYWIPILIG